MHSNEIFFIIQPHFMKRFEKNSYKTIILSKFSKIYDYESCHPQTTVLVRGGLISTADDDRSGGN